MFSCTNRLARKEKFVPDPLIPDVTDNEKFYKKSGYDRGHNMPAFDNECDQNGNNECYYYSNITPQSPHLNRGDWKKLEDHTRDLVMKYDSVRVWCGSIGSIEKIGKVSVPSLCWKVIYIKSIKKYEVYLFDQVSTTFKSHLATIDSIYKLTGIKLE
jgi:endonuclease G